MNDTFRTTTATNKNIPHNLHLAPPLNSIASDGHVPLQNLLYKLWVACQALDLDPETRFTSLVLLHRYYALDQNNRNKSDDNNFPPDNNDNDNYKWVGAACLILGMKAEEQSRRLRDVINMAQMLDFSLSSSSTKTTISEAGQSAGATVFDVSNEPPQLNEEYWKAKAQIVSTEQAVLRVLQFDTIVSHPHRLVLLLMEQLDLPPVVAKSGGSRSVLSVVTAAWTRLNDAQFHAPALTHAALTLACAAIVLAHDESEASGRDEKNAAADLLMPFMGEHQQHLGGGGDVRAAMQDLRDATDALLQKKKQPLEQGTRSAVEKQSPLL